MSKRIGEPEGYSVCAHCHTLTDMQEKTAINAVKYIRDKKHPHISSNHIGKTIGSFNLCPKCFTQYQEFILQFANFKFKELQS